jgi:DNA replication protein DnaC
MAEVCKICEGAGMRVVERADGARVAQRCVCQQSRRGERMIAGARIPPRYAECCFENFDTKFPNADRSLQSAVLQAKNFVKLYPYETDGKGLLIVGQIGVGKTHLAVATLRALIAEREAKALFYDYRDLLKELQNSYERKVEKSESEVLAPVLGSDVLVLDEIGASKPTDWSGEAIAHIINTRYNERKTTIITSNHINLPAGAPIPPNSWARPRSATLGDRVTDRIRSRIQEMCLVIEMTGEDFRERVKQANFRTTIQSHMSVGESSTSLSGMREDQQKKLLEDAEARMFRDRYQEDEPKGGARLGSKSLRKNVSGTD